MIINLILLGIILVLISIANEERKRNEILEIKYKSLYKQLSKIQLELRRKI